MGSDIFLYIAIPLYIGFNSRSRMGSDAINAPI